MSWISLLTKLRDRGLDKDPDLAIGDGAMGFWAAMDEVYPQSKHQRCWVHRTANVLDRLPKSKQPEAKSMIHEIYQAGSRKEAEKAFERFIKVFEAKFPKATECLMKSKGAYHAVLRFSCGTLVSHTIHKPHRVDVLDGETEDSEDQRMRQYNSDSGNGVSIGSLCREKMEET